MKSIEVSARTMDDAISQGLEQLGVAIGDVTVDIIDEGSKGLFGFFGSKPAKVRLTLNEEESDGEVKAIFAEPAKETPSEKPVQKQKAERKPAPTPAPVVKEAQAPAAAEAPAVPKAEKPVRKPRAVQPRQAAEASEAPAEQQAPAAPVEIVPAEQIDRALPAGKAQAFLQDVTKMMGVNVSVNAKTDEDGNVRVDMQGDTLGVLIGRRGETLDALQYLTSLQVNKGQSDYTRVTLDTENYRAKREEALVRLANRMANRAQKTGRKVSMEPMNPYERRILHSALQDNPAVETHSEGEEPNRHVVITLKQNA